MKFSADIARPCCNLHRWPTVLLPLIICTALASGQSPNDSHEHNWENQKRALAHLEEKWLNALNSADLDAIADILADDFQRPAPDSGQFVTKSDLLSYYRSHLSAQNTNKRRIEDLTVTIYGSTAVTRGAVVTTNPEGKLISKLLFTDVFVQRTGKWQAVSAQENSVTPRSGP